MGCSLIVFRGSWAKYQSTNKTLEMGIPAAATPLREMKEIRLN